MKNQKIEGFETNLIVEKLTLKDFNIPKFNQKETIDKLMDEILSSSFNQLVQSISEKEPDMPITIVEAFVKCYFDFEIDNEYDVKTMSYNVKVTPIWKAADLVDTESKEFKLLTDYALKEMDQ